MSQPEKDRREYPRVNKRERREFARASVRLETQIMAGNETEVSGWTRDLSVKGVFILCPAQLPAGARCRAKLSLGDPHAEAPVIEVSGWVVRCEDDGMALQFTDFSVECFNRLRNYFW